MDEGKGNVVPAFN